MTSAPFRSVRIIFISEVPKQASHVPKHHNEIRSNTRDWSVILLPGPAATALALQSRRIGLGIIISVAIELRKPGFERSGLDASARSNPISPPNGIKTSLCKATAARQREPVASALSGTVTLPDNNRDMRGTGLCPPAVLPVFPSSPQVNTRWSAITTWGRLHFGIVARLGSGARSVVTLSG